MVKDCGNCQHETVNFSDEPCCDCTQGESGGIAFLWEHQKEEIKNCSTCAYKYNDYSQAPCFDCIEAKKEGGVPFYLWEPKDRCPVCALKHTKDDGEIIKDLLTKKLESLKEEKKKIQELYHMLENDIDAFEHVLKSLDKDDD